MRDFQRDKMTINDCVPKSIEKMDMLSNMLLLVGGAGSSTVFGQKKISEAIDCFWWWRMMVH